MRRTHAYVDGFNLYHAIDDLKEPQLKWLDLRSLAQGLLRTAEILGAANYFSAYATWRPTSYSKHRTLYRGASRYRVNVVMGNFKKKNQKCRSCGATWIAHDEEGTDVHIAVQLVADAIRATCERLILISADSDLVPALNLARQHATAPIQVFVAAPPGRLSAARALGSKLEITVGRLRKALSPPEVVDAKGKLVASCPYDWR